MSGRIPIIFCLATLILSSICSQSQARIWVDSEGRSVDAEFVSYDGTGDVTLRRNDNGKTIHVAFTKFSEADKRRIETLRDEAVKDEAVKDEANPFTAEASPADSVDSPAADVEEMQEEKQELLPGEKDRSEADARRQLARTRKWADTEGNKIQAKFVRIFEGNVILLQGNKGHSVDFYKLSDADQEFLRDQMQILGEEDLVPPIIVKTQENQNGANNNSAIASSPFPGGMGMGPAGMGPSGMNAFPNSPASMPTNNFQAERDRMKREFEERRAKLSMPTNRPPTYEPQKIASNTPAHDPWANQASRQERTMTSPAPPRMTPPPMPTMPTMPTPPMPTLPRPTLPSSTKLGNDRVWECQTCHTQFDTVEKPSGCYFCWTVRIGVVVLITLVGGAVKGVMRG